MIESFFHEFNELIKNKKKDKSIEIVLDKKILEKFVLEFSKYILAGDWIFLDGDLGAGKTYFSNLLAKNLGALENSTSPTFSLINIQKLNPVYQEKLSKLIHLDLYRLNKGNELLYLGLENEFEPKKSICLFEWPYQIEEEDYNNFFKQTNCPQPSRILELKIEVLDKETRSYQFSFLKI